MSDREKVILPDGRDAETGADEVLTERGRERLEEEDRYQPVIVKRTDEIRRHPDDVLTSAVEEGREQIDRPALSLALSAVAAGLIVCFTAMAVALVTQATARGSSPLVARLGPGMVYPLGFILCILSGTQLFTEHTATAVYPVLDRQASVGGLLRLWGLVIGGNLLGAALSAGLLAAADEVVGAREGYVLVGRHLVSYGAGALFASAVLAGWLMALGAWLTLSTPAATGQIALIYGVTFLIGLGGLHHSIAGSAEMFAALFVGDEFTALQAVRYVVISLAGNTVGGSCFVAALNYVHIRRTREVDGITDLSGE